MQGETRCQPDHFAPVPEMQHDAMSAARACDVFLVQIPKHAVAPFRIGKSSSQETFGEAGGSRHVTCHGVRPRMASSP